MSFESTYRLLTAGARFSKEHAMLRQSLAVIAGFATWSVVWLVGNEILVELHVLPHGPSTPVLDTGALLALLVNSMCATLAAGYSAAKLTPSTSMRHVLVLGGLLVVVGMVAKSNYLDLMPVWYHVAFLVLLLPVCVAGAKLRKSSYPHMGRRRPVPTAHQPRGPG
jgi:hypothetical protein